MIFEIRRAGLDTWNITPTSGVFEGQVIGCAYSLKMTDVTSVSRTLVGRLRAVFGARLREDAFRDPETRRAFSIGGVFKQGPDELLTLDFEGLMNWQIRPVARAQSVIINGSLIHGHGVTLKVSG